MEKIFTLLFLVGINIMAQNSVPKVSNVNFAMRNDRSKIVDITYDVYDADGNPLTITVDASSDGGATWGLSITQISGAIGTGITSGANKSIIWYAGNDHPNFYCPTVRIRINADDQYLEPYESIEMVTVQCGTFMMGSKTGNSNERPVHSVTLSTFKIMKYEITQKLWKAVMGTNPSYFTGDDNRPVERVSWNSVQQFITKLNQLTGKSYRLPTEAEWEYAARGGNQSLDYTFAGSNDINAVAWYYDNSGWTTHPIGTKAPNELGIYDMSGNVWEWCNDWYGDYNSGAVTNPQGPISGTYRVLRGGSWLVDFSNCRSAVRYYGVPGLDFYKVGGRLVENP